MTDRARESPLDPQMQDQMQQILQQNNSISLNNVNSNFSNELNQIIERNNKSIISTMNSNMSKEDIENICGKLQTDSDTAKRIYGMKIESDLILPKLSTKKGTNWDSGNIETMSTWIKECNMQQFVYEYTLDKITKKSVLIKILILVFCAIQTLISCSNLGINENEHPDVITAIKICIPIISMITYILSHVVAIAQFEDNIKAYTLYSNDIETFLNNIISVASMKIELRPDGDEFILRNAEVYAELNRRSPRISQSMWQRGMALYDQYTNNNEKSTRSRKKRIFSEYMAEDAHGQSEQEVLEVLEQDQEVLEQDQDALHQINEQHLDETQRLKPLNQRDLTQANDQKQPHSQSETMINFNSNVIRRAVHTTINDKTSNKADRYKPSRPVCMELVQY
jgi:hypothetical protein